MYVLGATVKLKSYSAEEIINTITSITSVLAVWSLPVPLWKQLGVDHVQGSVTLPDHHVAAEAGVAVATCRLPAVSAHRRVLCQKALHPHRQ